MTSFRFNWNSLAVTLLTLIATSICSSATGQTLSRGHRILQQRGLQIQAMVVPDDQDPGLSLQRFAESSFTAVNLNIFDRTADLSRYLGPAVASVPVGMWINNGAPSLNEQELGYLPNLVSLQFHDELNIAVPQVVSDARTTLSDWREAYPDVIGYLNHISGNTDAELRNYLGLVQPDMLMFATYPFNGQLTGGSPTDLYVDLQRFRRLALGGHDGTGQQPIPFAHYLQTFTSDALARHQPSGSEMRLNQFAGWAFGAQFATAFFYTDVPNESEFEASLFTGVGDATPRQPAFNNIAETNRQSRNLGPALVRLKSTHVSMVSGEHALATGATATNALPAGVPAWVSGIGSDPYLMNVTATSQSAANAGLRGDLAVGQFAPLQGSPHLHFMILNGLTAPNGNALQTSQQIRMEFDFDGARISSLLRLSRTTGQVEVVPLQHDGASRYHLEYELDGGTGDLFKYNDGARFASGDRVAGGYVVATTGDMTFVDGDGMSRNAIAQGGSRNVTSLSNGNVVARVGTDVWQLRDAAGNLLASRQLNSIGEFRGALAVGGGGYAAVTSSNVAFVSSDGESVLNVWPHALGETASLTNGNMVARMAGTDDWRLYNSMGQTLTVRTLDNSGAFNAVAALGNGGYAAVSESRIIFMAADGQTVSRVVTDVAAHVTTLSNGNILGLVGQDHWRIYAANGQTFSTRQLDGLGSFTDAAPLADGGFVALSDRNAVFVGNDGQTVRAVIPQQFEHLTALSGGNVVARLVGTDFWNMYDSNGALLASRLLPNDGSLLGIAATGLTNSTAPLLESTPEEPVDLATWKQNFGVSAGATSAMGDADGDGDVDGADFLALQRRASGSLTTSIPEPTSLGWHALGMGILWIVKFQGGAALANERVQAPLARNEGMKP